jgi:hypothetical protein
MAIFGALMAPVFSRAIHAAHETSALEKMRQLHAAYMLYRSDNDGDARYGTAEEMGLPTYQTLHAGDGIYLVSKNQDLWEPACGEHPDLWRSSKLKYVYPVESGEPSASYYKKYQDNAILIFDENCTDPEVSFHLAMTRKKLIGVRLSGQAQKITTVEHADSVMNWHRD